MCTNLLTPWSRVLLEKLTGSAANQEILWVFLNMGFYGEALLAPHRTPKLEDQPSSAVRDCLFNLFATTLHIGGRSSIRNLRTRHAVVTGTHLTWLCALTHIIIWFPWHPSKLLSDIMYKASSACIFQFYLHYKKIFYLYCSGLLSSAPPLSTAHGELHPASWFQSHRHN